MGPGGAQSGPRALGPISLRQQPIATGVAFRRVCALPPPATTLYNVHMSRFTASQARQNFANVLNQAAGGQSVTIERGKLRFRLVLDERRRAPRTARPVIEILDPAVANGDWTWRHGRAGLSFKQRTKA